MGTLKCLARVQIRNVGSFICKWCAHSERVEMEAVSLISFCSFDSKSEYLVGSIDAKIKYSFAGIEQLAINVHNVV